MSEQENEGHLVRQGDWLKLTLGGSPIVVQVASIKPNPKSGQLDIELTQVQSANAPQ